MDLGNTIKELRKEKGIRQNVFAEKCNLSPAYLSQIESNQKEPNISTLREIAKQLDVPLPILFFLSLDEADISEKKRDAYRIVNPALRTIVNELFLNANAKD